jgi:hypothetical protein
VVTSFWKSFKKIGFSQVEGPGHANHVQSPTEREITLLPKRHYPKLQRRHDAILLEILGRPCQNQKEIAKATGYSPSQVSRILCSSQFQERYEGVFQSISIDCSAVLANLRKVR